MEMTAWLVLEVLFGVTCCVIVFGMVIFTCVAAKGEIDYEKRHSMDRRYKREETGHPPWEIVGKYRNGWKKSN